METDQEKVVRTDKEWKELLTSEQYRVLRKKGTERPYTGKYNTFEEDGVYKCGACGAVLFSSESKFDSHSNKNNLDEKKIIHFSYIFNFCI